MIARLNFPAPATSTEKAAPPRARGGGWVVLGKLAEGRFSEVWLIRPADRPPSWPGDYVLKQPRPGLAEDPIVRGMFQREAEVAGGVTHPHLLPLLSRESEAGMPRLIFPRLHGRTLAEQRERGPLPQAAVWWIGRQVAEALAALHQAGWLHGDLKPANIFLSSAMHATVLDFGMARRLGEAAGEAWMGTPHYAPPEQHGEGGKLQAALDLFSLGAVLCDLLTGAPTETADFDPRDRLARLHAETPRGARELLSRLLAREPLRRPTAEEAAAALLELEIDLFPAR